MSRNCIKVNKTFIAILLLNEIKIVFENLINEKNCAQKIDKTHKKSRTETVERKTRQNLKCAIMQNITVFSERCLLRLFN